MHPIVPPAIPAATEADLVARDHTAHVGPEGWDLVEAARTATLDALAGYDKMAEHAVPEFAPVVAAFRDLHHRHGAELTRLLAEAGRPVDSDGSMMGTVNRLVVGTRALVDDIDADVLKQIHSGEEHVLEAYGEALAADLPQDIRDRLDAQHRELTALLADHPPRS
jgi:uncharacterized protein (TIGR02284 family)